MYLSHIRIENFRVIGSSEAGTHFEMDLSPGLNVLVGENDSGKTAVIDALRYSLLTTSMEYLRPTEDDFRVHNGIRAKTLTIRLTFAELTQEEQARYLEWLTLEGGKPYLYITLTADWLGEIPEAVGRRSNVNVSCNAGRDGTGPRIESEIREFLRCTYLKPLRDATTEMSAGRGSRLAQILKSHPEFRNQATYDSDPNVRATRPKTLVEIMRDAEHEIEQNAVIVDRQRELNEKYLNKFTIGENTPSGAIGVAQRSELRHILEKLELFFEPTLETGIRCSRGLGYNNVLFMATELLLLGGVERESFPLLLIEEPEAHLHPQLQTRLMRFLDQQSSQNADQRVQIIVTTHSPTLASQVSPEKLIVLNEGKGYSLAYGQTKLVHEDYRFLQRFLDATKANLFFAKGVLIVEGDAENILLPVIADKLGRPLDQYGVSIVNVGHRGLFRYSRIFQRTSGSPIPVPIACITDRDIVPNHIDYAGEAVRKKADYSVDQLREYSESLVRNDGDPVKTFVSTEWTFEYDMALTRIAPLVHRAIQLAKTVKNKKNENLDQDTRLRVGRDSSREYKTWVESGQESEIIAGMIYRPLKKGNASKSVAAQFLAELITGDKKHTANQYREALPRYIVDAIDYVTMNTDARGADDAA